MIWCFKEKTSQLKASLQFNYLILLLLFPLHRKWSKDPKLNRVLYGNHRERSTSQMVCVCVCVRVSESVLRRCVQSHEGRRCDVDFYVELEAVHSIWQLATAVTIAFLSLPLLPCDSDQIWASRGFSISVRGTGVWTHHPTHCQWCKFIIELCYHLSSVGALCSHWPVGSSLSTWICSYNLTML